MIGFGSIHRGAISALAAVGVLAAFATGRVGVLGPPLLAGFLLAVAVPERWRASSIPSRAWPIMSWLVLAGSVAHLFAGGDPVTAVVGLLLALQVVRLATRRGAQDDRTIALLALAQLAFGAWLGTGVASVLALVGAVVVAPVALAVGHLRGEVENNHEHGARDRTGMPVDVSRIMRSRRVLDPAALAHAFLLAIPLLAASIVLGTCALVALGGSGRATGFSARVDLGVPGPLRPDPALVMRIRVEGAAASSPHARLPVRLRGMAHDTYDGHAWSRSRSVELAETDLEGVLVLADADERAPTTWLDVELAALEPGVVFVPERGTRLRSHERWRGVRLERSGEGEIRAKGAGARGLRYSVAYGAGSPLEPDLAGDTRALYLALPVDLSTRVRDLANEWTRASERAVDRARAIEARLRSDYRYDIASGSMGASRPLDDFLFESMAGHCELFATAMAVTLRIAGVPTRIVTGFRGGAYNSYGGFYGVRQSDAHAWVEVHVEGTGWTPFDPTPTGTIGADGGVATAIREVIEANGRPFGDGLVRPAIDVSPGEARSVMSRWYGVLIPLAGVWAGLQIARARRRRRAERLAAPLETGGRVARSSSAVTRLYEQLDVVMARLGAGRPPGVPPNRHVVELREAGHPLADEIASLTELYIRGRFGGLELGRDDVARIEARIAALETRS